MTCPEEVKQKALQCCEGGEYMDCDNCPLWGVPYCTDVFDESQQSETKG